LKGKRERLDTKKRTHDKRPDAHQASASVVDRSSGVGFGYFPQGLGDAYTAPFPFFSLYFSPAL